MSDTNRSWYQTCLICGIAAHSLWVSIAFMMMAVSIIVMNKLETVSKSPDGQHG